MSPPSFEGSDLPPLIQRAIARAMSPHLPLTASERVALATLIARVEARDGLRAFWVRRLNFAELFGRVERTISGWLSSLEDKGWITKEQGRTRWGNFSCLTLHLTDQAAKYLGLTNGSDLSTAYRKKTSLRYQGRYQGLTHSSRRHLARKDPPDVPAAPQARGVPADCAPLLELGLSHAAVFKLMGIATRHRKRLGDIVAARFDAIGKARHPYAFIASLARDPVDYASVHVREWRALDQDAEQREARGAIEAAKQVYQGAWVPRGAGRWIFVRPHSVPEQYETSPGGPRYVGALVGERLVEFWEWLAASRPPQLAMPPGPSGAGAAYRGAGTAVDKRSMAAAQTLPDKIRGSSAVRSSRHCSQSPAPPALEWLRSSSGEGPGLFSPAQS